MRLRTITEGRDTYKPYFRLIPSHIENELERVDVGEVNETLAELQRIPSDMLLSRESEIYRDTVDQYRKELKDTGHFADPGGYPDDTFFPFGVRFGNKVIIMDGTHRCQAQFEEGMSEIMIHVFEPSDLNIRWSN